jgi:hypothetical protein
MSIVAPKEFEVNEETSARYSATLKDETGAAIGSGDVSAVELTVHDRAGTIVNGLNATNILNANGGTLDAAGALTYTFTPADNQILICSVDTERHTVLLHFEWAAGSKAANHIFFVLVKNILKVGEVP